MSSPVPISWVVASHTDIVDSLFPGASFSVTLGATPTLGGTLVPANDSRFRYRGAGNWAFGVSFPDTLMYRPSSKYPDTYGYPASSNYWLNQHHTRKPILHRYHFPHNFRWYQCQFLAARRLADQLKLFWYLRRSIKRFCTTNPRPGLLQRIYHCTAERYSIQRYSRHGVYGTPTASDVLCKSNILTNASSNELPDDRITTSTGGHICHSGLIAQFCRGVRSTPTVPTATLGWVQGVNS